MKTMVVVVLGGVLTALAPGLPSEDTGPVGQGWREVDIATHFDRIARGERRLKQATSVIACWLYFRVADLPDRPFDRDELLRTAKPSRLIRRGDRLREDLLRSRRRPSLDGSLSAVLEDLYLTGICADGHCAEVTYHVSDGLFVWVRKPWNDPVYRSMRYSALQGLDAAFRHLGRTVTEMLQLPGARLYARPDGQPALVEVVLDHLPRGPIDVQVFLDPDRDFAITKARGVSNSDGMRIEHEMTIRLGRASNGSWRPLSVDCVVRNSAPKPWLQVKLWDFRYVDLPVTDDLFTPEGVERETGLRLGSALGLDEVVRRGGKVIRGPLLPPGGRSPSTSWYALAGVAMLSIASLLVLYWCRCRGNAPSSDRE